VRVHSTRRPEFNLPALACDAHCHVFGPGDRFPYAPERRYTPEDAPKEALIGLHDRLGLQRAVIVQASCHGTDNRALLDCLAYDPGRFRGVVNLDDNVTKAGLATMTKAGVRGVRFNFVRHLGGAPKPDVFNAVVKAVADFGWHIVLHLDAPDIAELSPMIRALPTTFVIDHMGRIPAKAGLDQLAFRAVLDLTALERCWVKVSGAERIAEPPFTDAIPFAAALMALAPHRVLWGTDFPHPNARYPVDEADLVDMLPHYGDAIALQRLLVDNPARLYDF
jgi:2-pyrone-4,6-dicarboxylate lactonase